MKLTTTAADAISYPLFDLSKITVAQGGYSIDTSILPTALDYVKKGTLCTIASATRLCSLFKTVIVITGGSTSAPRVTKNNLFKVGDYVMVDGRPERRSIDAIVTTNSAYDVWTLNGAITGLAAADCLVQAATLATTNSYVATVEDIEGEVMTISVPDADFDGSVVHLHQASNDTLALAYSNKVLTITLAQTTANKNTVALIQTALQALGDTESVSFGAATCTGTVTPGLGAVMHKPTGVAALQTATSYARTPNAMVLETVKYEGTPTVTVVIAAMEIEAANVPYPITAGIKAALGSNFHFKA